jgi:endonuclease/exonuclease/phosphatase (EEP) superfamily protein YafD
MNLLKQVFTAIGILGLILLSLLTLVPWIAQYHHLLELLAHFRFQVALLSLLLLPWFGLLRQKWPLVLTACLVCWHVVDLLPWYLPSPDRLQTADKPSAKGLKVLMSNMLFDNPNTTELRKLIQREHPDLVIIQELNQRHVSLMASLGSRYPHTIHDIFKPAFGIGIWSRVPLNDSQELFLGPAGVPSLYARLTWQGQSLHLLTTHPYPPISATSFGMRNAQYDALAAFLAGKPGRQLLIGDLNVTPWSPYYRKLEQDTGLRSARRGFGLQQSWPAQLPFVLRIPIDHALVSPTLEVLDLHVGPDLGSDHLPLILTLGG